MMGKMDTDIISESRITEYRDGDLLFREWADEDSDARLSRIYISSWLV